MYLVGPISQSDLYETYVRPSRYNSNIVKKHLMKYWYVHEYNEQLFVILDEKNRICALCAMEQSNKTYQEDLIWLKFVSVLERYWKKGLSTRLIESVFQYCADNNKSLLNSSYSDYSSAFLPHTFAKLSIKYPKVDFFEQAETREAYSRYNTKYSMASNLSNSL